MARESGRETANGEDIVEVLRLDHAELRALLAAASRAGSVPNEEAWVRLIDTLVRHEVAEELIVYPALLGLPAGFAVVQSRTADQAAIRERLVSLDRAGFGTTAFAAISGRLGLDLVAHLDREDTQVLPILASRFDADHRAELGHRFVEVGRIEPTLRARHGARLLAGPSVVDSTTALAVWIRDSAVAEGLAS